VGGDATAIASWSLAALAYSITTVSNSTSQLTYLCTNFPALTSRYSLAFLSTDHVTKFAEDAICGASRFTPPSAQPVAQNQLWYMKSYTGGIFTAIGYAGINKTRDTQYYMDLCWYVESTLLRGLWVPCRDTDEGIVDAESSYCASAGYYGKDDYSRYTTEEVSVEVKRQADMLMSKFMGNVMRVLLGSEEAVEYVCGSWGIWTAGIEVQGLVSEVLAEVVCKERTVVEVQQAKMEMLTVLTDMYIFQLLHAGNAADYPGYLCKTFKPDGFVKLGLDGSRIVQAVCAAAATPA
tara:strand:- start:3803 stop:4681 length:879 start_codon:yes stop_codon:yes gene_type:complete